MNYRATGCRLLHDVVEDSRGSFHLDWSRPRGVTKGLGQIIERWNLLGIGAFSLACLFSEPLGLRVLLPVLVERGRLTRSDYSATVR